MSAGMKAIIVMGVIFLGIGVGHIVTGGRLFTTLLPGTGPISGAKLVTVNGYIYENGGAHAVVASCNVYVFDENMNFLEAPTTDANGKFALSSMRYEGEKLYLQVRQAAPGSADPYLSDLIERIVPFGAGEAGDTLTIDPIFVWDATETAPTQTFKDQAGNAISDNSANYLNTSDTQLTLFLSAIDEDTAWGPDYTTVVDYSSEEGDMWTGPILVWKGTAAQAWSTSPTWTVSDPTNIYYIWSIPQLIDSSASSSDDSLTFTVSVTGGFAADASVVLDCYDTVKLNSDGTFAIGNLSDGPGGGPSSAVTTKVA